MLKVEMCKIVKSTITDGSPFVAIFFFSFNLTFCWTSGVHLPAEKTTILVSLGFIVLKDLWLPTGLKYDVRSEFRTADHHNEFNYVTTISKCVHYAAESV